jgi:hypothetical protein
VVVVVVVVVVGGAASGSQTTTPLDLFDTVLHALNPTAIESRTATQMVSAPACPTLCHRR